MQILWTLSEEPLTTKLLLAVEQALPYGFAAILYGEMMSATRGLGFAVVVATATQQPEKGFAIFFITLSLLLVLTTTLRFILKRFLPPRKQHGEQLITQLPQFCPIRKETTHENCRYRNHRAAKYSCYPAAVQTAVAHRGAAFETQDRRRACRLVADRRLPARRYDRRDQRRAFAVSERQRSAWRTSA